MHDSKQLISSFTTAGRAIAACHAILLATCLATLLASGLAPAEARAEARVEQLSGTVEIGRGSPPAWSPLDVGATVGPNDRVRTGPDGRVEIVMEAGTLRVHENSVLRLPPAVGDADHVALDEGHSLFDVLRRAGRRFEVHTPTVVVSVKGTRFSVDANADLGEVAVYRGMVGVRGVGDLNGDMETLVREGFIATGGSGTPIELDVAPSGDPWASWQDFRRNVRDARDDSRDKGKDKAMSEVDRAKAGLLRNTDSDVLRRAAERKPEVAERLRELKRKKALENRTRGSVPASPDLTGIDPASKAAEVLDDDIGAKSKSMRQESRERAQEVREQIRDVDKARRKFNDDGSIAGGNGSGPPGGGVGDFELEWEDFEGVSPTLLLVVAAARDDVQTQYQTSGSGWTLEDVETAMLNALVSRGLDPVTAGNLVDDLIGN